MPIDLEKRMDEASKKKPGKADEPEARMTFGEHIEELRKRILKSLMSLMVALFAAMAYYEELVKFITRPFITAMTELGQKAELMPGSFGGPIMSMMKLAFIIALFAASPVVGYQLWAFVGAGLYPRERRWVVMFAPLSFVLFTLGCLFGYFQLIPICLVGMAKFTSFKDSIITNQYLFTDYLNLVMMLTIILGAVFQIPLVMIFLSLLGIVSPSSWNRWRKPAIIINCVFAAVVTPADPTTMIMVLVPMLALYEVGVLFSYFLGKRKNTPQTS